MEKRGVVKPGTTPDVETTSGTKAAKAGGSKRSETRRLDNDLTKRAADAVRDRLR